jgi:hypothetical protein
MAYRDTERTVILRTRCGAERRIERFHNPGKFIEMPLRPDMEQSFIGDPIEIPAHDYGRRRFEFHGQEGGQWVYEEVPEKKPKSKSIAVSNETPYAGLREEMNRHQHTTGSGSMGPASDMQHILEAFLPVGFQLVNVKAQPVLYDALCLDMRVEVSGKSMAAARCQGWVSRMDVLRQENERLKTEKDKLRRARKESKENFEKLAGENRRFRRELNVLSEQLATDEGRDRLARENDELRRNNGQLEYALAQKVKEANAARSRYAALVDVRSKIVEAVFGKRDLFIDEDGRTYGVESRPISHATVHIGSCEIGSGDPDRFAHKLAQALDDPRTFKETDSGPVSREETFVGAVPASCLDDVQGRQGPVQRADGLGIRQVTIEADWAE